MVTKVGEQGSDNVPTQGSCKMSALSEVLGETCFATSLVLLRFGRSESGPKWNIIRPLLSHFRNQVQYTTSIEKSVQKNRLIADKRILSSADRRLLPRKHLVNGRLGK